MRKNLKKVEPVIFCSLLFKQLTLQWQVHLPSWRDKKVEEHLAGGFGDAKICEQVSTEIRKEMAAYLEPNKRRRPLFLEDEDGEAEVVEVTADEAQQNESS